MSKAVGPLTRRPPLVLADGCCEPIAAQALTSDRALSIAPMFKALGDPIRLRLMSMIASEPEVCVCNLTTAFDVSGPTISHHLRVLREAGLVDCRTPRHLGLLLGPTQRDAPTRLAGLLDLTRTANT